MNSPAQLDQELTFEEFQKQVIEDYRLAYLSRELSLVGRREVLSGKAKFGIFGDGKELAQIAQAHVFKKGDFRSGYYRDQTWMLALGILHPKAFFHGLYATTDIEKEPMSAGRQMGGHYMTPNIDQWGNWLKVTDTFNSSADISCTAGQMPRLLGLAQASKLYRQYGNWEGMERFTSGGTEVAWGSIGNASTSEGHFFEVFNAAGVLQVPMVISIWDDDYGISVPAEYHTTKSDISEVLKGFARDGENEGYEIIRVPGWDYAALLKAYQQAETVARQEHVPVLLHVYETTQPQGHSTSGSHERYKSAERLAWEAEYDCNAKFREWILDHGLSSEEYLKELENEVKSEVRKARREAREEYLQPQRAEQSRLLGLVEAVLKEKEDTEVRIALEILKSRSEPIKKDLMNAARLTLRRSASMETPSITRLKSWYKETKAGYMNLFNDNLYDCSEHGLLSIPQVKPTYRNLDDKVDGRVILRDNFDQLLNKYPNLLIFGEDTGRIGDVNQGLEGLQEKYGEWRVADTGIRETSIVGQGIGLAMRGFRPIAEIQYLDYVLYALQTLSDDLATLRYRTQGMQRAPLIIRTRGHRLEGIWHSGSPMGGLVHLLRGMYILSPRNMTQAAGFYNTLLKGNEPALVIESLNGYRLKEIRPTNLGDFYTPIGVVQTMKTGTDITVVSYGSTLRMVEEAARILDQHDIDLEVIDAQTLLPFDKNQDVVKSLRKTNRLLIVDEDVPGGCSAYLLQEIMEKQKGFRYLDSAPRTLTAQAHRPAYSTDGDYFSKPSVDDIVEMACQIMHEANPVKYPSFI